MENILYAFHKGGILESTEEWYNDIAEENIAHSYNDILDGKHMLANSDQIEFYNNHKDYDLYHLYYMIELTDKEKLDKKAASNEIIRDTRERLYSSLSDPLYMSYVKYTALGQDEKASEAYNQWIAKVKEIEEANPYIE